MTQPAPADSQDWFVPEEEFLADARTAVKPSADSFFNEDTQRVEVQAQPQAPVAAMTQAESMQQTRELMQFRDYAQKYLLAWGAGDVALHPQFGMNQAEFEMLCQAWHSTVGRLGRIPGWFNIAMAEAIVMGPKLAKLFDYRKLQDENRQLRERLAFQEARADVLQRNAAAQTAGEQLIRRDGKKMWQVDLQGRFMYRVDRSYIREEERMERPNPNDPLQWERLARHNHIDTLNVAFNLGRA